MNRNIASVLPAPQLDPPVRVPLHLALAQATKVASELHAAGVEIHSAFDNGRRMVLLIERSPAFVVGHKKRSHPNGFGGITTLYAASFHGVQLEWTVDTHGEVAHG